MRRKLTLITLILVWASALFAQERMVLKRELAWDKDPIQFQLGQKYPIKSANFKGAAFDEEKDMLPLYNEVVALKQGGNIIIQLTNEIYQPASPELQQLLQDHPFIPEQVRPTAALSKQRKQPYASVSFAPLRKNPQTGQIELLTSFDMELRVQYRAAKRSARVYASNSVLSSGKWYKLSVDKDGIYRINYDLLESMGVNVATLDPRTIRIYGNGGGLVPEANDQPRFDDLAENAIQVVGESDGSFDQGDYILFYAKGPHQWSFDTVTSRFHHQIHYYSDVNHYFLTTDLGAGKRITTQASAGSYDSIVNRFDHYVYHESEDRNLIQSGRVWYGEEFDQVTSQSFSFGIPNLVSNEQVYLKAHLSARSTASNSTFTITASGTSKSYSMDKVPVSYEALYASSNTPEFTFSASSSPISVDVAYTKPSGAVGWLNYIELNARRNLSMGGDQMAFRDAKSIGNKTCKFDISNATAALRVWEVTDPVNVTEQLTTLSGSKMSFNAATTTLRQFVAFTGKSFFTPEFVETVSNQNLHGKSIPNMIIVTHPDFQAQAEALAELHRLRDNLAVLVTTPDIIYNEFSSGVQDISAIRDFVKMFYDRAGDAGTDAPQYLLLVGGGSYDYRDKVTNNTNFVPVYQSPHSTDPVLSYSTDDFYGFLDEEEGGNMAENNLLDIAIGRLPVRNVNEAKAMVEKIQHYVSNETYGNWRNIICFVADDEDNNIHMNSAEDHASFVEANFKEYNVDKIYFDAFQQEATAGGSRYPDAKEAFDNRIYNGALIVNYTGHGGVNGWAHERVLDVTSINSYDNYDNMPLFVTATCEFSRYDNPEKNAAGVQLLMNDKGGAIALMTTVRLVYSSSNANINEKFFNSVFTPVNGAYPTMGQVIMNAKNASLTGINNRKFSLLGDPAIKLAYPQYQVKTTSITSDSLATDTLKALAKMTITGEVTTSTGSVITNFNGIVYPTIFDKPLVVQTLKNDAASKVASFSIQKNIIYKGKASVTNGQFSFTFIVPKDISYQFGNGKISYYSDDGLRDANGYDASFIIGGTADEYAQDNAGPNLKLYMNDEKFVFGGMTNESPTLIVKLEDASGINTVGNGIGHDITAVMDGETDKTTVLNEYYEAELDNYQKGEINYPLSELDEGTHTLKVKAWDVYNNSGEAVTEFVVVNSEDFSLEHVLNYPNPFTTRTAFFFEHNRPGQPLDVQIRIYTVSGRLIKTIRAEGVESQGFRSDQIEWDGLDDFGDKIGKGVYIYELTVNAGDGFSATEFEKLVILR